MFGSKKDPLVDVVKKVMEGNEVRRQVERDLNSELGIYSKQVLPNEYHSRYDHMLSEKTKIALNEELKGNQTKIDANRNNRIDAHDFKLLRGEKNAALEEADSDKGTFSGAVTDTKTGKKVPSSAGAKPVPPPKPTAPRYSGADKNALDQKFVAAATEVLKPTSTPTSTPAAKSAPTPAKPMSDKEALDQKFKDAAAELDEALTGKGKLRQIYFGNLEKSGTAPDDETSDKHRRNATRAAGMMSNIAAKKAVDDVMATYAPGKKRSKMPYKGPKYKKSMDEESLDETSLAKAKKYVEANIKDRIERAEYRGHASGKRGDDYPKGLFKNPADNIDPSDVRREKGLKMVMNKKVPFTAEEAMDEVFNTKKGEETRKRYIKGAEDELDRNSALMKDVDKGDKRAIARMKSREDGVFNAQRRKKLSEEDTLDEMAPKGDKYERMIRHIKDKYSKNGLTDNEKSIAYATAWKAKNKDSK